MNQEKEQRLKEREKVFDRVYYIVLGFVVTVVAFYVYHFNNYHFSIDPSDWGVFGDFFGGTLNPLLAFFSFMLLLLNLKLQREQLDNAEEQLELNREELKLTREELRKAANAQVDSAKVMNEQLKTQALQQFDSQYQHFIIQLNLLQDKIGQDKLVKWIDSINDITANFDKAYHSIGSNQSIINYRNYLILVLKKIDQAKIEDLDKQLYIEMITAPMADKFLIALHISFYDLLVDELDKEILDKKLHQILARYMLFKNLKLLNFRNADFTYNSIGLTKHLGSDIYRDNHHFDEICSSTVYQDVRNNYYSRKISVYIEEFFKRFEISSENIKIFFKSDQLVVIDKINKKNLQVKSEDVNLASEVISFSLGEFESYALNIFLATYQARLQVNSEFYELQVSER